MRRGDLLQQLATLTVDLTSAFAPASVLDQARALCATGRVAFGAAAVSIAALHGDDLHFVAADGEGADGIVGVVLPVSRGVAGYVALTGQSMAIDRASDDPRFARDVAERTGYIPTTLLVVPVRGGSDEVLGVLSVLDRSLASADALVLASSFATQAALLLPLVDEVSRLAQLLLDGIVAAVRDGEGDLAAALRTAGSRRPEADPDLVRIAATLAQMRSLDPATRARVATVLDELVALATTRRRR